MIKFLTTFFITTLAMVNLTNACSSASPTNSANFCASFKTAASCHCTASGLPAGMCQDVRALYSRMISIFGSLEKACQYQHYTPVQNCMDEWKCYLYGGIDSKGRACSGTTRAC